MADDTGPFDCEAYEFGGTGTQETTTSSTTDDEEGEGSFTAGHSGNGGNAHVAVYVGQVAAGSGHGAGSGDGAAGGTLSEPGPSGSAGQNTG